jgi:periplasmic divalent cation tolerance protein
MKDKEFLVILCSCPDHETARRIAHDLVSGSLVACVNVVPGLRSIYRWNGSVQDDAEVMMILKTTGDRLEAARARLVELHPYDVPEFIALAASDGHDPYLQWVVDSTRIP